MMKSLKAFVPTITNMIRADHTHVLATFHPSYLLRLKDRPGGEEAYARFVGDLRTAAGRLVPDKSDR